MKAGIPRHTADAILGATAAILSGCPDLSVSDRRALLAGITRVLDGCQQSQSHDVASDDILTYKQVGAIAKRTERAILNWVNKGLLHPVILPGQSRALGFRRSEVEALLFGGNGETK